MAAGAAASQARPPFAVLHHGRVFGALRVGGGHVLLTHAGLGPFLSPLGDVGALGPTAAHEPLEEAAAFLHLRPVALRAGASDCRRRRRRRWWRHVLGEGRLQGAAARKLLLDGRVLRRAHQELAPVDRPVSVEVCQRLERVWGRCGERARWLKGGKASRLLPGRRRGARRPGNWAR